MKAKSMDKRHKIIQINRAPVMTLWATVVAEREGFKPDEALTLGKAVAGLNAQAKGRRLGIFEPSKESKKRADDEERVQLLGRPVPVLKTSDGIRAVTGDKPISPKSVQSYLERSFGDDLATVRDAMKALAESYPPEELEAVAYGLYEQVRPSVAGGKRGWGAKGELDIDMIRTMSKHEV